MGLRWYVIHTRVARERQASEEISGLGFEAYYPEYPKRRIHNHQIETILRPLFPRYIFARFDSQIPGWAWIKNGSKNVYSILMDMDRRPIPVGDDIITEIKTRSSASQDAVQAIPSYESGQAIKIKAGPFQGFEGLFSDNPHDRAKCLIEILLLGAKRKVELPISDIEAA